MCCSQLCVHVYTRANVHIYKWRERVKHQGFTHVDWERNTYDKKSTLGQISNIGSVVVSLYNRKHRSIAPSSVEEECMVASQVACEAISIRKILVGLFG